MWPDFKLVESRNAIDDGHSNKYNVVGLDLDISYFCFLLICYVLIIIFRFYIRLCAIEKMMTFLFFTGYDITVKSGKLISFKEHFTQIIVLLRECYIKYIEIKLFLNKIRYKKTLMEQYISIGRMFVFIKKSRLNHAMTLNYYP